MNGEHSSADALPPPIQMLQMIIVGRQISHAITVAARLDLATSLGSETCAIEELAQRSGSNEDALSRLMRSLASVGVFSEVEPGRFRNTPLSDTLRRDAPASTRPLALFFGHDSHVNAWLGLEHSVMTGLCGFEQIHGMGVVEYVTRHPEVAEVFDSAMTAFSASLGPAIIEAYDFAGIDRLVDVGGGQGQLLASVLARHPSMRGVLFDLPHVVARSNAVLAASGVAPRVDVVGGSFFDAVPPSDAYIMKSVLHDWNDADATRILENIHRAANPGARLILAEAVIGPGNDPDITKFMDLEMLVMTNGGRERSRAQWTNLLRSAAFTLERVIPTASNLCVIEARRS
jgi:SAM-dependent methyltransferase